MRRCPLRLLAAVPLITIAPAASGCDRGCTDIGCIDGVGIDIETTLPTAATPVSYTTCLDDECTTEPFDPPYTSPVTRLELGLIARNTEPSEREVEVTVRVEASDGAVLVVAAGRTTLVRNRPNGDCGDTCYSTGMRYDAASRSLVSL